MFSKPVIRIFALSLLIAGLSACGSDILTPVEHNPIIQKSRTKWLLKSDSNNIKVQYTTYDSLGNILTDIMYSELENGKTKSCSQFDYFNGLDKPHEVITNYDSTGSGVASVLAYEYTKVNGLIYQRIQLDSNNNPYIISDFQYDAHKNITLQVDSNLISKKVVTTTIDYQYVNDQLVKREKVVVGTGVSVIDDFHFDNTMSQLNQTTQSSTMGGITHSVSYHISLLNNQVDRETYYENGIPVKTYVYYYTGF